MKIVLQRVRSASVVIEEKERRSIDAGLLLLVGFKGGETGKEMAWLARKIVSLRVFADQAGKMNRSLLDVGGDLLVISQFTLYADTRKGNRPSFNSAAPPKEALQLYDQFISKLEEVFGKSYPTGKFGANMRVTLENDGPVTLILDTD